MKNLVIGYLYETLIVCGDPDGNPITLQTSRIRSRKIYEVASALDDKLVIKTSLHVDKLEELIESQSDYLGKILQLDKNWLHRHCLIKFFLTETLGLPAYLRCSAKLTIDNLFAGKIAMPIIYEPQPMVFRRISAAHYSPLVSKLMDIITQYGEYELFRAEKLDNNRIRLPWEKVADLSDSSTPSYSILNSGIHFNALKKFYLMEDKKYYKNAIANIKKRAKTKNFVVGRDYVILFSTLSKATAAKLSGITTDTFDTGEYHGMVISEPSAKSHGIMRSIQDLIDPKEDIALEANDFAYIIETEIINYLKEVKK